MVDIFWAFILTVVFAFEVYVIWLIIYSMLNERS
jgi:hypothetical protein